MLCHSFQLWSKNGINWSIWYLIKIFYDVLLWNISEHNVGSKALPEVMYSNLLLKAGLMSKLDQVVQFIHSVFPKTPGVEIPQHLWAGSGSSVKPIAQWNFCP